jgi:hypothetical protein
VSCDNLPLTAGPAHAQRGSGRDEVGNAALLYEVTIAERAGRYGAREHRGSDSRYEKLALGRWLVLAQTTSYSGVGRVRPLGRALRRRTSAPRYASGLRRPAGQEWRRGSFPACHSGSESTNLFTELSAACSLMNSSTWLMRTAFSSVTKRVRGMDRQFS